MWSFWFDGIVSSHLSTASCGWDGNYINRNWNIMTWLTKKLQGGQNICTSVTTTVETSSNKNVIWDKTNSFLGMDWIPGWNMIWLTPEELKLTLHHFQLQVSRGKQIKFKWRMFIHPVSCITIWEIFDFGNTNSSLSMKNRGSFLALNE